MQYTDCIHKIRWAIYRIGMDQNDLSKMIEHNRNQTLLQKTRRDYLGGTAEIMEKGKQRRSADSRTTTSYTTMCKILKLVSGCETFSFLTKMQSEDTHLSIDMEALIGRDPINTVVDQEAVLLLYQYGFTQLYGASAKYIGNLIDGKSNYRDKLSNLRTTTRLFHSCNMQHLKMHLMIKRILVLVPDQVKAAHAEGSSRRQQRSSHLVGCSTTYQSQKEHQKSPTLTSDQGVETCGGQCQVCASAASGLNHDHNRLLPKRCHRQAHQQRGIRQLRLHRQECKPREEDIAHMHLTKGPPVTPQQSSQTPVNPQFETNGEAGGTKTHKTRVAARGDLRAEIGQEGKTEVGLYYPR